VSNLRDDESDALRCPNCGAQLTRLLGGGYVETFCPACDFAVRQSPLRRAQANPLRLRGIVNGWSATAPKTATPRRRPLLSRITSPLGIITIIAMIPLVFALRALYTGYDSLEPVLLAELYIWFFSALWLAAPTVFMTGRRLETWQFMTLAATAVATAMLVGMLAPQIGEPNYCGDVSGHYSLGLNEMPPRVYRCTSLPFEIVGGLLGWWGGYWIIKWWEARGTEAA
jgi:hypothetical protein